MTGFNFEPEHVAKDRHYPSKSYPFVGQAVVEPRRLLDLTRIPELLGVAQSEIQILLRFR